jgi:DNA (cytosine-5)-methyltransferase 1
MRPLVIDSFAGGGGASTGIRAAIGRDPDYALNHDRLALAMHRINHPDTHHIEEDVWNVDAVGLCAGRDVGLLWMSPDCKHFSKAKGGKPREKAIRGLAWVGVRWIKSLPKRQRPLVVCLENVEEFAHWGPLLEDGRPCPIHRGATFKQFVAALESLGYVVEWREMRACDYGAPTIRKRLFLIARRDGKPIVWPDPTHGAPDSEGVLSGRLKPWRTAAEIIDWSLPCPSIFESSAEIKAKHGIRAIRPLADATHARIAKGTMRYVVNAAKPFLVSVNHGDSRGRREYSIDDPANTMTASRGEALITPFVSYAQQGGGNRDAADPLHTITASPKDQNAVVAPFVTKFNSGSTGHEIDRPLATVTSHASETHGGGAAPLGLVAPHLIRVDQTSGDPARKGVHAADAPVSTLTTAGAQALVSGYLVPRYGERPGQEPRARSIEEPAPVIVPTSNEGSLAAVHLTRQFGQSIGSAAEEPVGTITAGGAGKAGVVAAFLAQHNSARQGVNPGTPISTITAAGGHQNVVAAHLINMHGKDGRSAAADSPAPTFTAGGNHAGAVYAFLSKWYGTGAFAQAADDPLHTVTAKDRCGVVTVMVGGQPYAIVDIGMRMLTPRERFNAQGFPGNYEIDRGELEDGSIVPLTLEQQGRMCGNSVCPDMAEAIVAANYDEAALIYRPVSEPASMPLFAAE